MIEENVSAIKSSLPENVRLCAAVKTRSTAEVLRAVASGVDLCGENREDELTAHLSEGAFVSCEVHFIGKLQTNKIKKVAGKVSVIESVDSLRLLYAINSYALKNGFVQDILLEINIGGEVTKGGFSPDELPAVLSEASKCTNIHVRGLMTIPPPDGNEKYFRKMQVLFIDNGQKVYDNIDMEILSMGMTNDYKTAVKYGSGLVRIGTGIFGPREV